MGTAYNPGLMVTELIVFSKERKLPLEGEVLAKVGQRMHSEDVIARAFRPGNVEIINMANRLNVPPKDIRGCMLKKAGDQVKKDELIALSSSLFGLFKYKVLSPIDGTVETVSEVTGQVILREAPIPIEMRAYIDGEIVKIIEKEGAVIQTPASFIQGIFGIGGEVVGILQKACQSPNEIMKASHIKPEHKGKILFGGSLVTSEAIVEAIKVGVTGIIVGGINDKDLREFLGYDQGVAITGTEKKGITLIFTEGFGEIRMADKTFILLCKKEGKKTSINGATQIRAGVIRPEIVIPISEKEEVKAQPPASSLGLRVGGPVRIIREPNFGKLAKVVSLPVGLKLLETETEVRVVEVELENGEKFTLPRANVELIEG